MDLEEIKKYIAQLGAGVTEENAQGIALLLLDLTELIQNEYTKPEFSVHIKSFTTAAKKRIEEQKMGNKQMKDELLENQSLFLKRAELEENYEKIEAELKEMNKLKAKNEILSKTDLACLREEIVNYTGLNTALISNHLNTLSQLNDSITDSEAELESQLSAKVKEAITNLTRLNNTQFDALSNLDKEPIQSKCTEFAELVNSRISDYNTGVEKLKSIKEDLNQISAKHDEVMDEFKIHQLENEKIYGVLKNKEGVLNYVELLSKEISERLQKYDAEIKELVKTRNQLPIYKLEETKKYQC